MLPLGWLWNRDCSQFCPLIVEHRELEPSPWLLRCPWVYQGSDDKAAWDGVTPGMRVWAHLGREETLPLQCPYSLGDGERGSGPLLVGPWLLPFQGDSTAPASRGCGR